MREHSMNAGKAIKKNTLATLLVLENLLKDPEFPLDAVPALNAYRADFLGSCGWMALRLAEDPQWARRCLSSAICLHPKIFFRVRTLIGFFLSILPMRTVRSCNRILNSIHDRKESMAFREDYT